MLHISIYLYTQTHTNTNKLPREVVVEHVEPAEGQLNRNPFLSPQYPVVGTI